MLARLKPLGFQRRGNVAWRDTNGDCEFVIFQATGKQQLGDGSVRFAVFVGVRLASLRRFRGWMGSDELPTHRITDYEASLNEQLLPGAKTCDVFVIGEKTNLEQIEEHIYDGIIGFGLPWLEERNTDAKLARVLMPPPGERAHPNSLLDLLVLLSTLKRRTDYDVILGRLVDEASVDSWVAGQLAALKARLQSDSVAPASQTK